VTPKISRCLRLAKEHLGYYDQTWVSDIKLLSIKYAIQYLQEIVDSAEEDQTARLTELARKCHADRFPGELR
jgi:hypothetical protein